MIRALVITLAVALVGLACASQPEPVAEPEPVVETTPEPAPEPVVETPVAQPAPPPAAPVRQELPKTASVMPGVGLAGLGALGLAGIVRWSRRISLRRD